MNPMQMMGAMMNPMSFMSKQFGANPMFRTGQMNKEDLPRHKRGRSF